LTNSQPNLPHGTKTQKNKKKEPEKIRLKTKTVSSVTVGLPLFYRSFSDEPAGLAGHTSASLPYFPFSEENLIVIRINGTSFYAGEMSFLSVTHAIVSKQLPQALSWFRPSFTTADGGRAVAVDAGAGGGAQTPPNRG